jgi:hypothetical protein
MKIQEIRNEFNKISECKITEINFDILKNRIKISLDFSNGINEKNTELVFEHVSSFYFVNNTEEQRKNFVMFENGDYLELTSIDIVEGYNTIEPKANEKWIEQYKTSINISIEIWNRVLFIESSQVIVGDKEFILT